MGGEEKRPPLIITVASAIIRIKIMMQARMPMMERISPAIPNPKPRCLSLLQVDNPMIDTISATISRRHKTTGRIAEDMAKIVKKQNKRIMTDSEMMNPSTHIML